MTHEWFGLILETSLRLAFAILPAAPLLGQKLPTIADEKRFFAKHPGIVSFAKPNF
jgi:hypothetical protein